MASKSTPTSPTVETSSAGSASANPQAPLADAGNADPSASSSEAHHAPPPPEGPAAESPEAAKAREHSQLKKNVVDIRTVLMAFYDTMNDLANMEQEVQRLCADSYRISTVKRIEELESEIGKPLHAALQVLRRTPQLEYYRANLPSLVVSASKNPAIMRVREPKPEGDLLAPYALGCDALWQHHADNVTQTAPFWTATPPSGPAPAPPTPAAPTASAADQPAPAPEAPHTASGPRAAASPAAEIVAPAAVPATVAGSSSAETSDAQAETEWDDRLWSLTDKLYRLLAALVNVANSIAEEHRLSKTRHAEGEEPGFSKPSERADKFITLLPAMKELLRKLPDSEFLEDLRIGDADTKDVDPRPLPKLNAKQLPPFPKPRTLQFASWDAGTLSVVRQPSEQKLVWAAYGVEGEEPPSKRRRAATPDMERQDRWYEDRKGLRKSGPCVSEPWSTSTLMDSLDVGRQIQHTYDHGLRSLARKRYGIKTVCRDQMSGTVGIHAIRDAHDPLGLELPGAPKWLQESARRMEESKAKA